MTYVLLLMIYAGNSGSVTTAEFVGKPACEAAGQVVQQDFIRAQVRYTCTLKYTQDMQP